MSKVGIKDIAKKADVSIGTVDRVLHNRGQVADTTKKKVLKAAEDLQYKPNLLARSLASRKDLSLAVLLPKASGPDEYWYAPVIGIRRALEELKDHGIKLCEHLFNLYDKSDFVTAATNMLKQAELDGVILAPFYYNTFKNMLQERGYADVPCVLIDSRSGDEGEEISVAQNSYRSGRVAAELMLRSIPQRRAVGVVDINASKLRIPTMKQRSRGFVSYIKDHHKQIEIKKIIIDQKDLSSPRQKLLDTIGPLAGLYVTTSRVWQIIDMLKPIHHNLPFIIGYDLLTPNLNYLKQGKIKYLIGQRPELQGYYAMHEIVSHLMSRDDNRQSINIPIDIITAENFEMYTSFQAQKAIV